MALGVRCIFLTILLWTGHLNARVFDYKETSWGISFKTHQAWMGAGSSPYGLDLSEGFQWDGGLDYALGLEPGVLWRRDRANILASFLLLVPWGQSEISGASQQDGARSLDLNLSSYIFAPQLGLEVDVWVKERQRVYIGGAVGMAKLVATYEYSLSPSLALDWGLDSFVQKIQADTIAKSLQVGYEFWLSQDTTLAFEIGYRDLFFREIKYRESTLGPDGSTVEGEALERGGGSKASLNKGGAFSAVGIKIYPRWF